MFLKDALLRCSRLEEEVASVYTGLSTLADVSPENAASWVETAKAERQRGHLLHALSQLSAALGDDGPFLVQAPVQLSALRRVLDSVSARMDGKIDSAAAVRCAETLDAAGCDEVHRSLLEVAELEIRRVLRLVESQTKGARPGSASRSRDRKGRRMVAVS